MKFEFGVSSTTKRVSKSNVPELTLTPTENKLKINEVASRLLQLRHGDHIMVISNVDAVIDAAIEQGLTGEDYTNFLKENASYALAKGVAITKNGEEVWGTKKLTTDERKAVEAGTYEGEVDDAGNPIEIKYHGAKLANSSKNLNYGNILEFSDSKHYPLLGGNDNNSVIYEVNKTLNTFTLTIDGQEITIDAYFIEYSREEEKIVRKNSKSKTVEVTDDAVNEAAVEVGDETAGE